MDEDENAYFRHRAATELQLSRSAVHPKAVQAHGEMARRYLTQTELGAKDQGLGT